MRAFSFTIYGTMVLVSTYFPLFYAKLGFTNGQIGVLYALGPMISLIANLLWSIASDKFRTIKKIMCILLIGQIIMSYILSISTTFSVIMLMITIFYFFFYPVFPLSDTIAINAAKQHGKSFITVRIFGSIGYAFFALAIGYVLSVIGASKTMWVTMAIAGIALLITMFIQDQSSPVAKMDMSGIWSILRQKELLWFFGCVFCLAIAVRMNDAFLTITLKDLGAGENVIGWAQLASSCSEIPIFLILSIYGERFKELPLLIIASLVFATRFLLVSLTDSAYAIIAIQTMHSFSFGIFYVTSIRMLTRMIPDQFRATGMALFTIAWSSASGLLSGTFGGIVFEQFGRQRYYLIAMTFALIACVGFATRYFHRDQAIRARKSARSSKKA
ncbi:MFS transporter [Paenibacillus sp. D2_2]|uniref:MFS transporter n=1 Tax=Paenibacillus sp. D2_2 TaxID=3073092 RepID=UPI002814CF71|nr:MFS transporter [Paenibacillus sp. D2_2]WMT43549.1 MFS transporter [Paenibacillus sp. D2_2]